MDKLLNKNALDVFYSSIQMKKNRPAYKLSVICNKIHLDDIVNTIFNETTTIGIRYYEVNRVSMDRKFEIVNTIYGDITTKIATYNNIVKIYPEYEDCVKISKEYSLPLWEVYNLINSK